jgi:hypothetical protein
MIGSPSTIGIGLPAPHRLGERRARIKALQARPEAILLKEELGVLRKLTVQAAEAVEAFGEVLEGNAT